MPSISADDPAYMASNYDYWRVASTGAHKASWFLVYLGLKPYSHLKVVDDAIQGLTTQQLDLMLSVWRALQGLGDLP
jgi:hypothetical protein